MFPYYRNKILKKSRHIRYIPIEEDGLIIVFLESDNKLFNPPPFRQTA